MGHGTSYTWALIVVAHVAVVLLFITLANDLSLYTEKLSVNRAGAYADFEDQ